MKILYKILNTLLTLTLIPVLLFLPMFRFIMVLGVNSDSQILSILGSFINVEQIIGKLTGINVADMPEEYTIRDVFGIFSGDNAKFSAEGFDTSVLPAELTGFFSVAGILFALALVLALAVLILGIFTKQKKVCVGLSAASVVSAFAAGKCFSHIASLLVSGQIAVSGLLAGFPAFAEYEAYMQYINIDIRLFKLGSAFSMTVLILAALLILNICFAAAQSLGEKRS